MKKLLFTGASGFLGRNIKPILSERYDVATVGIAEDDDYRVDMSATSPRLAERYDVVLHAAGKAHVYPKTADEVKSFYDVNVQGTINLCRALEKSGLPKSFIFISTLDVYGITSGENIDEDCPKKSGFPLRDQQVAGRRVSRAVGGRAPGRTRDSEALSHDRALSSRKSEGDDKGHRQGFLRQYCRRPNP